MIFHIAIKTDWENAEKTGEYVAPSFNEEGFIHLSRIDQVVPVANAFYKGNTNLVLLEIDPKKINHALKYETVNDEVYPHLYSKLSVDAVICAHDFVPQEDGAFQLPKKLQ